MLEFIDVEGQEYTNPDLTQVLDAVTSGNQAEWEGYSGQAGLYWRDDAGDKRIIFTPGGSDSYLLQYYDTSANLDYYFISLGQGSSDAITEVSVGGDAWLIPSHLFIPKEKAVEVLSHFFMTHERSNGISWLKSSEVSWPEE